MNRRNFITNSSMACSAIMSSNINLLKLHYSNYKMGYQLFSVNQDMNEDTLGTLTALKGMGYEDFEIYGFDPSDITYYGIAADKFALMLDDMGLSASSGHYGFAPYLDQTIDEMKRFVDQCIKGAQALNTPYITWPWIAPAQRTRDNFKKMSQVLNIIGEQINNAGLGFAYHNHGFEFENYDGEIGFDIILADTDPTYVKLQMDMYWVMHAGTTTPKELIEKSPGRYVMWHIKDMDKVTRDYTELGNGSIDYIDILPNPKDSGLEYYYIEQGGNFTHSAIQSAADSAKFLKNNLKRYL